MEVKINNQQSFGWFIGTHRRITNQVLESFPNLQPHQDNLEIFSQRPDLDENGRFYNWHFYSSPQDEISLGNLFEGNKTFFKCQEHIGGIIRHFRKNYGGDNALAKYQEHVGAMLRYLNEGKTEAAIEHAGRSMHFLQDMTQPQHTQRGLLSNKIIGLQEHLHFEHFVKNHQENYFTLFKEKPFLNNSFVDIFMENVRFSKQKKLPTNKVRDEWFYIGRDSIHQALHSTKEFLSMLSNLMQNSNFKPPFA